MKRKNEEQTKLGQGLLKGLQEATAFEKKKMDLRTTAMEIAEKVIKGKEYITSIDIEPRILARAYLDAAKELETTKAALSELEEKHEYIHKKLLDDIEYQKKEITKLKEENEKLRACEARLKKSREVLMEAVDKILNSKFILDYGIIAHEAIKADDEIMGDVK